MKTDKRILLVEDDCKFRLAMMCALRETGCLMIQAPTISAAEKEIASGHFDLIILDGDLPDGSGLSWLKSLRDRGVNSQVVFVSGIVRDSGSFIKLRRELGVSLILHKPVSIAVFKEEIGNLVDHNMSLSHREALHEAAEELSILATDYITELPARLISLADLIHKAATPPHNFEFITLAAHEAHMLRGTAGLFGLIEVGQSMGWIEDTLRKMMANKARLWSSEGWTTIEIALTAAHEESKRVSASGTRQSLSTVCETDPSTAPNKSGRLRVLLIDDDRTFTRRAEAILSADSILVYSFLDSDYIDELLGEIRPDLLLLDLHMPACSGADICERIRLSKEWKNLPILIVTGANTSASQMAAMKSGANGYVPKASANMELLSVIKSHIHGTHYRKPPAWKQQKVIAVDFARQTA